jgi:hypothetical protein
MTAQNTKSLLTIAGAVQSGYMKVVVGNEENMPDDAAKQFWVKAKGRR